MISSKNNQNPSIAITVNTPENIDQEQLLLDSKIVTFKTEKSSVTRESSGEYGRPSTQVYVTAKIPVIRSYNGGLDMMALFSMSFVNIKVPGVQDNLKIKRNRLLGLISEFFCESYYIPYSKGEIFAVVIKMPRELLLDNCKKLP